MVSIAKLFTNGASQAVRLPKEFRFEGTQVCVKRVGAGVLLFPKDAAWSLFADSLGKADKDFMTSRKQPRRSDKRTRL